MAKLVECPNCGFKFDLTYSRAVACGGCSYATLGDCGYIRCPKCGHEFTYQAGWNSRREMNLPSRWI